MFSGMCYLFRVNRAGSLRLWAPCVLFWACASGPAPEAPSSSEVPAFEASVFSGPAGILDYRGKATGAGLPPWLDAYFNGGEPGIEAMSEYENVYAFVNEKHDASPAPPEHWLRGFNVDRAFSRIAASRLIRRFTRNIKGTAGIEDIEGRGNPDAVYGGYYETAVKAAFNARFSGPWKAGDFWIREAFPEESAGARYRYFILILVPRDTFEREVFALLDSIKAGASKEQSDAFNGVKNAFFEGF